MGAISLRLEDDLERRLAAEAHVEGKTRSEVIRTALSEYLGRRERERFMAKMVGEMREAYGDPARRREAIELGEELVALSAKPSAATEGPDGDAQESGERWWT